MSAGGRVATGVVVRPLASGLPLGFLSFALGMLMLAGIALGWVPDAAVPTAGLFLAGFAVVLLILATPALVNRPLMGGVLLLSATRAGFGAAYQLGGPGWTQSAEGVVALAIAVAACYAGLAFLVEDVLGRTVLPTARRRPARQAIDEQAVEEHSRSTPPVRRERRPNCPGRRR